MVHDDECYGCGYGGDVMMCDMRACSKVYHLKCLGLDKQPHGEWQVHGESGR